MLVRLIRGVVSVFRLLSPLLSPSPLIDPNFLAQSGKTFIAIFFIRFFIRVHFVRFLTCPFSLLIYPLLSNSVSLAAPPPASPPTVPLQMSPLLVSAPCSGKFIVVFLIDASSQIISHNPFSPSLVAATAPPMRKGGGVLGYSSGGGG